MPKRTLSGVVVSSNSNKTITVNVIITIIESKPISKIKKWKVIYDNEERS